jgi:hypothetical protein
MKRLPKNFYKLATGSREFVDKSIAHYFGGESKEWIISHENPEMFNLVGRSGRTLPQVVLKYRKGFAFGVFLEE